MRMNGPVLVTGAAGFVGSHLLDLLATDDLDIVACLRPGTTALAEGRGVRWVTVELQDQAAVTDLIGAARPQAVYHLAGAAHVGDSWSHTRETFAGNVLVSHHLFEALRAHALTPRVLVTGSATIYTPLDRVITENDAVLPTSPYGTSKLAQEMLALRAWEDDGLPTLLARSFNHVGPRQPPTFVAASLARQVALIERGRMAPVLTVGNLEPRRDIMDVRDTVRAYRALMQSGRPGVAYNVCSGTAIAIRELVDRFRAHASIPIAIEQDPARLRPNDVPLLVGDATRLRTDTGWTPQIGIEQTVDDLLAYWRSAIPAGA